MGGEDVTYSHRFDCEIPLVGTMIYDMAEKK